MVRAGEQVAFPVAGHRAVGDLGRARPDRHRVHDLPAVLPGACRRPRPPQGPLRAAQLGERGKRVDRGRLDGFAGCRLQRGLRCYGTTTG